MDKKKRVLEIADELQKLGYPEVADKLREAVTSGKPNANEQSESNEGGEGQGGTTTTPPTGGPQPPPDKERP